jgi:hypothetical protein
MKQSGVSREALRFFTEPKIEDCVGISRLAMSFKDIGRVPTVNRTFTPAIYPNDAADLILERAIRDRFS